MPQTQRQLHKRDGFHNPQPSSSRIPPPGLCVANVSRKLPGPCVAGVKCPGSFPPVSSVYKASGEPGLNPIAHPPFGPVREGYVRRDKRNGSRHKQEKTPVLIHAHQTLEAHTRRRRAAATLLISDCRFDMLPTRCCVTCCRLLGGCVT